MDLEQGERDPRRTVSLVEVGGMWGSLRMSPRGDAFQNFQKRYGEQAVSSWVWKMVHQQPFVSVHRWFWRYFLAFDDVLQLSYLPSKLLTWSRRMISRNSITACVFLMNAYVFEIVWSLFLLGVRVQ